MDWIFVRYRPGFRPPSLTKFQARINTAGLLTQTVWWHLVGDPRAKSGVEEGAVQLNAEQLAALRTLISTINGASLDVWLKSFVVDDLSLVEVEVLECPGVLHFALPLLEIEPLSSFYPADGESALALWKSIEILLPIRPYLEDHWA